VGLDTFASNAPDRLSLSPEDTQAFLDADIRLAGGVFSSGNDGSFRGKIYKTLIQEITGVSLLQDWIPPETVKEMYRCLADIDPQAALDESDTWDKTASEVLELKKFFKVCADRNLGLVNWW
jgi:hypothetical protein